MTEADLAKYLDVAEKSPKQVAMAVTALPDRTLRYKPAPEGWCILEILGSLADSEIVYAHRLRQMLADVNPVIASVDPDAWAKILGHTETPPAEMIALYGLNRHANLRLLRRLQSEHLEKSAYDPDLKKEVAVWEYVKNMGALGAMRLQQIEELKRQAK